MVTRTALTGEGSSMMRLLGGRKRQCSVVATELQWSPAVSKGSCSTGGRREVRRGGRLMAGSSRGWSSLRGDEAAVEALNSSLMGVLRWSGWDEKQMGMQEGSHATDSMWRERERDSRKGARHVSSLLN
jgi:hypothetical protein